jgi:hypothetical protein
MNTDDWPLYDCHKIVRALPIVSIGEETGAGTARVLFVAPGGYSEPFAPASNDMRDRAAVGDYAVVYADGYKSISPKVVFETGYTLKEKESLP